MNLEESIKLAGRESWCKLYDITTVKEHDKNIFRVSITVEGGIV